MGSNRAPALLAGHVRFVEDPASTLLKFLDREQLQARMVGPRAPVEAWVVSRQMVEIATATII